MRVPIAQSLQIELSTQASHAVPRRNVVRMFTINRTRVKDRAYRHGEAERGGLDFERFLVGRTLRHEVRRTVTDMDTILLCSLTDNPASIHDDHDHPAGSAFGKPLISSIFTPGPVIGRSVQDTTMATTIANLGMTETGFSGPVLAGDAIRAETIVIEMRESRSRPDQGIVTFGRVGLNQRGEIVCRTARAARMMKAAA